MGYTSILTWRGYEEIPTVLIPRVEMLVYPGISLSRAQNRRDLFISSPLEEGNITDFGKILFIVQRNTMPDKVQLRNSRRQPIRDGTPAWVLGKGLTTPHLKK
jgi:hypothetical protein